MSGSQFDRKGAQSNPTLKTEAKLLVEQMSGARDGCNLEMDDGSAAEAFLEEIHRLRAKVEEEGSGEDDGSDWIEKAVDLRTVQLLNLSESLRELEPAPELLDVRRECDRMVGDIVTGRLDGTFAIDRTDEFFERANTILLERVMEGILD